MAHILVDQLRFTRSEFVRGLMGVADPEAQRRFGTMNSLSWIVGHLAWQEQRYWLWMGQGKVLLPDLNERLAYGKPASTPPVEEMWAAWRQVTSAADPWLDALTLETISVPFGSPSYPSAGTFLMRVIYHYWYHLGEGMAIRQQLGHQNLAEFVGNLDGLAPYRPESELDSHRMRPDELIEKVRSAHKAWDALLSPLEEDDFIKPMDAGGWTLKDVIAHLYWHEEQVVGILRSHILGGSEWWNLPTEQRNQAIYDQNRNLPLAQVQSEAKTAYADLLAALGGVTMSDLHEASHFAQMPPDWLPWQIIAQNAYEHYLDHLGYVGEWARKQKSS